MTCYPTFASSAPAEAASVSMLRGEVVGYLAGADVCGERAEDIRLAVSEALSNAVVHAYRDRDTPGEMEVNACRCDDTLEVIVRDGGSGMAPRNDSPGLGLGLPVIARMADRVEVHGVEGSTGTEIRMCFEC
jgi:serine/threonine-protein kinase RsbW/stage II sporulation protein AB (anti-sigma F factor)